jgi:adenine-specific DNA methylase
MTQEEVKMLMAHLNKRYYLIAALMYGMEKVINTALLRWPQS